MVIQLNGQGEKVKALHAQLKPLGYTIPSEELEGSVFGKISRAACVHCLAKIGISSPILQDKGILEESALQAIARAIGPALTRPLPLYRLIYGTVLNYEGVLSKTKVSFLVPKPQTRIAASTPTFSRPLPERGAVLRQPTLSSLTAASNEKLLEIKADNDGFYVVYFDPTVKKATIQVNQSLWQGVSLGGRFDLLLGVGADSKGKDVKTLHRMLYDLGYLIPQEELKAEYFGEATRSALFHFNPKLSQGDLGLLEYQNLKAQADKMRVPGKERTFFSLALGKVVKDGVKLKGVKARVFDIDIGEVKTLLGQGLTDLEGNYYIYYSFVAKGVKKRPTLKVEISNSSRKEIASSSLFYQVKEIETINFVIGDIAPGAVSEFERVALNLAPFLQTILDSTKSLNDIIHLTAETGIETKKIFFFIHANKLVKRADQLLNTGTAPAATNQLPPFVFYGFFSQGFPIQPSQFLQRGSNNWRTALSEAQKKGIIPACFEPSLDTIINRLEELKIRWIASESSQLKNVFPDENARVEFLKGIGELKEPVRVQMTLSSLVGHDASLFQNLKTKISSFKDLAAKTREDWKKLLKSSQGVSIPSDIPGENEEKKRENYAMFLETAVKRKFPQTVLKTRLEKMAGSGEAKEVTQFLSQNEGFNFQKNHIDTFLGQTAVNLNGLNKTTLALSLKKLQRLSKLSSDPDDIISLQEAGVQSAYEITQMGQKRFVQKMEKLGLTKANRIYAEAQQEAAVAQFLLVKYGQMSDQLQVPSIPSWERLFGSLELCHCEHCCSVYSPAAYFVDILEFLDKRQVSSNESVKELLFKRRPDLGEIELSCENTLTPLPYIDLVNEILEDQISPPDSLRKRTTKSKEELSLEPEYLNKTVYEYVLTQPSYPWILPFDLPLEETRLYLQRLGLSRKELIEYFDAPYSLSWITEVLGLSFEQREKVLETSPQTVKDLWDVTDPSALSKVPFFLKKSDLTFEQLQVVTQLFSIRIESRNFGSCDLKLMYLEEQEHDVSSETLKRIAHSLRLWKKLAPRFGEEKPTLNAAFIEKLSDAATFQSYFRMNYNTLRALIESQLFPITIDDGGTDIVPKEILQGLSFETIGWIWLLSRRQNPKLPSLAAWDLLIAGGILQLFSSNQKEKYLETIALFCHLSESSELPSFQALIEIKKLKKDDSLKFVDVYKTWEKLKRLEISIESFNDLLEVSTLFEKTLTSGDKGGFPLSEDQMREAITLKKAQERLSQPLDLNGMEGSRFLIGNIEWEGLRKKNELPFTLGIDIEIEELLKAIEKAFPDNKNLQYRIKKAKKENHSSLLRDLFQIREAQKKDVNAAVTSMSSILKNELELKRENELDRVEGIISELDKVKRDLEPVNRVERDKLNQIEEIISKLEEAKRDLEPVNRVERDELNQIEEIISKLEEAKLILENFNGNELKKIVIQIENGIFALEKIKTNFEPFISRVTELMLTSLSLKQKDLDDFQTWINLEDLKDSKEALDKLLKELNLKFHNSSTSSLMQWILKTLDLSPGLGETLVKELKALPILIEETPDCSELIKTWHQMNIVAKLSREYSLSSDMIQWICREKTFFPPSFEDQLELLSLLKAHKELGEEVLNTLEAPEDEKQLELAKALEIGSDDLEGIDLNVPGQQMLLSRERIRLLKKGGITRSDVLQWIGDQVSLDQTRLLKDRLKKQNLFNSTQSIRDELRQKQRDALVAYLLHHQSQGLPWTDATSLYDHFLIDVEMNAFQKTSRIKQAISAVQFFVQKAFMGLEEDVNTSSSLDHEWSDWKAWMSSYRVWEANRKVFLYPENWIEPELRDNKSPFFEDFEKELEQNEITAETADAAFMHYLEKADQIAHLDICGLFHQRDLDESGDVAVDVLHVFGRTFSRPHVYYYRKKDNAIGEWTAWEKVDLDIEGDHLIPVVWKHRIYLFWPMVSEKAKGKEITLPTNEKPLRPSPKTREIRLAWSEYKDKKWTPKQMSIPCLRIPKSFLDLSKNRKVIPKTNYAFQAVIEKDALKIVCTTAADPNLIFFGGNKSAFEFVGRIGNPYLNGPALKAQIPSGTSMYGMGLQLNNPNQIMMPDIQTSSDLSFTVEIGTIPDSIHPLKILMAYEDAVSAPIGSLFLKTSQKTFFAEWKEEYHIVEEPEWDEEIPIDIPEWIRDRIDKGPLPHSLGYPSTVINPINDSINLEIVLNAGGLS